MNKNIKMPDMKLVYIIGIAILLNIISTFIFFRLDLTDGKIYSLSDASKKIVSELDDKVIVKCFFSKELPPQMKIIPSLIRDNLEEYKAYSNGNFHYEFIDPADKEFSKQIMDYQLPSAQVQMLEKDEFKVKRVFMGMVILYEDKKEIIPFVQEGDLPAIEYEITSRIRKLTMERLPNVAIYSAPGTVNPEEMRTAYQLLSSQYVVNFISPGDKELTPDKIDALLIIGPKENLSQEALKSIDDYIVGGGKAGFFIDKTSVDLQTQGVKEIELNLDSLMSNYGVKVNTDLIGDKQAGIITVRQQKGFFTIANQIKYPFLPMISNLSRTNPVSQKINAVTLYFASSLDTTAAAQKGIGLEIIGTTSEESFIQKKNYFIMADRDISEYRFSEKNIPVIALLRGSFTSFYDQSVKGVQTRMAVTGDSEFFMDGKISSDDNLNMFLNLVDWLTSDDSLISIRSKSIMMRPLDKVSDSGKTLVKWLNMAGIPILIIGIGFIKWMSNRRRKDFGLK
jgi:gliding-associated putative ABC transporter substrate-binding component GldG